MHSAACQLSHGSPVDENRARANGSALTEAVAPVAAATAQATAEATVTLMPQLQKR